MRAQTSVQSSRGLIDVSLRDISAGHTMMIHRRPGDGALFVASVPGHEYTLKVMHLQPGRTEVITTVDGRDTQQDAPGSFDNRGLVFTGSAEFTGFRVDDSQTRQFTFGSPDRSVAVRAGDDKSNVGVIGFAAWPEYSPVRSSPYAAAGASADDDGLFFGGAFNSSVAVAGASGPQLTRGASAVVGSVGTEVGRFREDRVGHTTFNRQGNEPDVLVVYYDTEARLRELGVIVSGPNPFPADTSHVTGYGRY